MTKAKKSMWSTIGTIFFSIICVLYMYPIVMVVLNSLKKETAITTATTFDVPTAETFAGLANYVSALGAQGFLQSFLYSAFITVSSVALILLCCSMCAWYITRVNSKISKLIYLLCAFSMVVPFQMV
ncbi:MAG: carbohydrate ABC transporter permease, partial [Anaerotignum sp.]|nr:carbohydrate ABC transporter permease [Anaerotignum sp.]